MTSVFWPMFPELAGDGIINRGVFLTSNNVIAGMSSVSSVIYHRAMCGKIRKTVE